MYIGMLHLHNVLRWVVLIAAVAVLVNAYRGWLGKKEFVKKDRIFGTVFTVSMDVQVVIGLVLYVISPLIKSALGDMSSTMKNSGLRYFAVEHISIMLIAVIIAHVGNVLARRADTDTGKFKQQAIWFSVSLLLILSRIPWNRALFPGL